MTCRGRFLLLARGAPADSVGTRKARLDMPDVSHFLLLHGAFHVGAAWDSAIGALAEIGFTAEAITFPGHGRSADRAGITFADYEDALIAALDRQPGPVVLVGHSAAGVVMQTAAPRAAGKVAALVFHNAFILGHGRSMIESIPPEIAGKFRADAAASPDNSLVVDADFVAAVLISPLIKWLFRLSPPDEECGGESRLAALRAPPCHHHGPGGPEQNENTAISARHGLPRGAGADELAHQ